MLPSPAAPDATLSVCVPPPRSTPRPSRRPAVGQRRHAAHGQAARAARAGGVLGLLPRQLAAHAALPEGVARALRRRRAARDRRPRARASRPAATRTRSRAAVERLGIEHPVLHRHRLRAVGRSTATAGWPARYLFDQRAAAVRLPLRRGRLRARPSAAIQELLGVDARPVAPVQPEDEPDALIVVPTPDQPGAYSGPYEAGGVWAVLDGRGTRDASTATSARSTHPGALPAGRARAPHRRRARARGRRRRDLPRQRASRPGWRPRPRCARRRGGRVVTSSAAAAAAPAVLDDGSRRPASTGSPGAGGAERGS